MLDTIYDGVRDFVIDLYFLYEDLGFLFGTFDVFAQISSAFILFSFILVLFYLPFSVFRLVVKFFRD